MGNKICIIGCGTFGSYLLKRLLEKTDRPADITVVEIGNHKTQSESEIGLGSISEHSKVSKDGRYFGLGGTSARWGGQVLFFDDRDNPNQDPDWSEIIRLNERHKKTVIEKLLGDNPKFQIPDYQDDIKTGIWLKYPKRNIFKRLNKSDLNKVKLLQDQRVVDFILQGHKITKVVCKSRDGQLQEITADRFYLTAGALESCRLLLELNKKTGILNNTDLGHNFGDHISTELFHVHNAKPIINGIDFTPKLVNGSLVTRRLIAQTKDGNIGFISFIFNKDIKAFKFLKEMLFGKRTTTVTFLEFISGILFLFKFGFSMLFRNKLHIEKSQWSLQLDMEQPVPNTNKLSLSEEKDAYGEAALQIDWNISKQDQNLLAEMRDKVELLLKKNNLKYTALYNPASTNNKVEDVYHPVGCLRAGRDDKAVVGFDGQLKGIENLYHFSTGMFPSAKSINPSAAVMCMVEGHLENIR